MYRIVRIRPQKTQVHSYQNAFAFQIKRKGVFKKRSKLLQNVIKTRLESHILAFSADFLNIQADNLRAVERLVGILDALHLMLWAIFGNQQREGRHPLCFVQTVMCRTLQHNAFIPRSKLVGNDLTATGDTERHVRAGVNATQFTPHRCTMNVRSHPQTQR